MTTASPASAQAATSPLGPQNTIQAEIAARASASGGRPHLEMWRSGAGVSAGDDSVPDRSSERISHQTSSGSVITQLNMSPSVAKPKIRPT